MKTDIGADDDGYETNSNTALRIAIAELVSNDTDADDDALSISAVQNAVGGTVAIDGKFVVFTPDDGFTGDAQFSYTLIDGNGGTGTANVSIDVVVPGPNVINGTKGRNTLRGTGGDDIINGLGGHDKLYGRAGNDTLNGGSGNDRMYGEDGNDALNGGVGNDTLNGGNGNDILNGGAGKDKLIGGAGTDTVDYSNSATAIVALFSATGNDGVEGQYKNTSIGGHLGDSRGDKYSSIERIIGSDYGDIVYAAATGTRAYLGDGNDLFSNDFTANARDVVYGEGGNDLIFAGKGDDRLDGGDGNDQLHAEDGEDLLLGRDGDDELYGGNGVDTLFGGTGDDILHGNAHNDTLQGGDGEDELYGDEGDDTLFGQNDNDTLLGGAGNDKLLGGAGIDILSGETGNDSFWGGDGNDTLDGGAGNDTLRGQAGRDALTGGAGDDVFIFGEGDNVDKILDFRTVSGESDVIRLSINGVNNFADVLAKAQQVTGSGGNPITLLIFGGGDTLQIHNMALSDLTADMFEFTSSAQSKSQTKLNVVVENPELNDYLQFEGTLPDDFVRVDTPAENLDLIAWGDIPFYGRSSNDFVEGIQYVHAVEELVLTHEKNVPVMEAWWDVVNSDADHFDFKNVQHPTVYESFETLGELNAPNDPYITLMDSLESAEQYENALYIQNDQGILEIRTPDDAEFWAEAM